MTMITDETHYTSYDGSRQSRAEYETAVMILSALTPLIGGEAFERIRRAAYCRGLNAAITAIQRITGDPELKPNNDGTLSDNLARLDRIAARQRAAVLVHVNADPAMSPETARALGTLIDLAIDAIEHDEIEDSYYPEHPDFSDTCPDCSEDWDDCHCDDEYELCSGCRLPSGDCLCETFDDDDDDLYDPELDFGQPDPFEASLPAELSSNDDSRTVQDGAS